MTHPPSLLVASIDPAAGSGGLTVTQVLSLLFLAAVLALYVPLLSSEKGRRSFLLAVRSLWLHKLRSFLSVLGIIIGTLSVVTLMAFVEGSMQDALDDIRRLGATNIIVRSVKPPDDSSTQRRTRVAIYGLTYDDYDRFLTIGSVTRRVPLRTAVNYEIRNLQYMLSGRVVATVPEYAEVNTLRLASGRFLNEDDDHLMLNVAVLGSKAAERLFPYGDPLGQTIRLGNYFYRVVGVLHERTANVGSAGSQAEDFNRDVYIPLSTCKVRFGERIITRTSGGWNGEQVQLSQVTLTVKDMDSVRPTGEVVRELLERYHTKNDWAVTVPLDRLEQAEREQLRYIILMVAVAVVSLVVGGIGIMNIMLATVTERTREIGIRRALGAKRRDITMQFLIEAVVQTTVGGLAGVALGLSVVLSAPASWYAVTGQRVPTLISLWPTTLSLAVSVGVGILFGWYPARRAALLDPIEALRHE
jgi:putative ABC transport system permease protein